MATYWDDAIAGRIEHHIPDDGVKSSVTERMRSLGFSDEEFAALQKVLAATESMNQLEQIAFAATQGLYDPKKKDFVSDGKPDLKFAAAMVHGQDYNLRKAELSRAVGALIGLTDLRTRDETAVATLRLERLIVLSLASLVCGLLMVAWAAWTIRQKVLRPVGHLSETAERLALPTVLPTANCDRPLRRWTRRNEKHAQLPTS